MSNTKPVHAHELEAAGEVRWSAKIKDGLLMVTDQASGEETQASAYTIDGPDVRFALPGDNGYRVLRGDQPGAEAFRKVVEKLTNGPSEGDAAPKRASRTGSETSAAS